MKKLIVFLLGSMILFAGMLNLSSCLDGINFDPNDLGLKISITGEIDAWLKENSVLWIVNKSKTVDIMDLKISRQDNDPAYPIEYPPGDIFGSGKAIPHGTSLASYHKPAPYNPVPWYKIEITYETKTLQFPTDKPDWWDHSYGVDYGVYPPAGPLHTITVLKQMPRGMDYVILFYKTSDGSLMVLDEDNEKHPPHTGDTIVNNQISLPSHGNQVIISGVIDAIINGQITITGLDPSLAAIVNEIHTAGQNALNGLGDLGTVISNAFDKHAQVLLDAFLNHKIEITNVVNVDTGMETLLDYLRTQHDKKSTERSITVYNASSSVIIDQINIGQNSGSGNFVATTNGNKVGGGDSFNLYLESPERNFDIEIQYHYIGSSVKSYKNNKIAITGNEYIVFYKQLGDNFAINKTTDMSLLMGSADGNDFIVNNDVHSVKFNILNESSAMRVVGLTIQRYKPSASDPMYYKEDADFQTGGPIGAAGGNDSVIFRSSEAKIDSGKSYTISIIGEDYRDAVGKGYIVIALERPLYIGGAVTLRVTEAMVQNAIKQNTPAITYQVTPDGGKGDPHNAAYDTKTLTFTFEKAPLTAPKFDYFGTVTVGALTKTTNPLVYTAACTATVDQVIQIMCSNEPDSNVSSAVHYVNVFKSQPAASQPIITTKYVFKDAYVSNKTVQRNMSHQLLWTLKYDEVTLKDGVETSRVTITKEQFGEWLVDSSVNSGYISFNSSGLLKIGPRPPAPGPYSGNDKAGVATWEFYLSVVFGQTVDGHLIEDMPYQSIPLFLGPWQIGTKKVYGLQVTLTIVN